MSSLSENDGYWIAHIVMVGILAVPAFVLTTCALCMAKRRKDPARLAFTYLKIAFAFFTLYVMFDTVSWVISFVNRQLNDIENYYVFPQLEQASDHIFNLGRWWENITHILILLSLFELASGILLVQTGQKTAVGRIGRFVALGAAALLAIIALSNFALWASYYAEVYQYLYSSSFDGLSSETEMRAVSARRLYAAYCSLLFVANVGIAALSVFVMVKVHRDPQVHQPAVLLLVCAVLWLLRNIWKVAYIGSWYPLNSYYYTTIPPKYIDTVDAVLNTWVTFVLLTILFALGAKKAKGLWSTQQAFMVPQVQQPWNGGVPVANGAMYPPPPQGYIYASPPPQQQHQMGWQQQPPMQQQIPQQQPVAYYPQHQQQQPVSEVSSSPAPTHQQPYTQGLEVNEVPHQQYQHHDGSAPQTIPSPQEPKPLVHG